MKNTLFIQNSKANISAIKYMQNILGDVVTIKEKTYTLSQAKFLIDDFEADDRYDIEKMMLIDGPINVPKNSGENDWFEENFGCPKYPDWFKLGVV